LITPTSQVKKGPPVSVSVADEDEDEDDEDDDVDDEVVVGANVSRRTRFGVKQFDRDIRIFVPVLSSKLSNKRILDGFTQNESW
jgi:hypothetical protein